MRFLWEAHIGHGLEEFRLLYDSTAAPLGVLAPLPTNASPIFGLVCINIAGGGQVFTQDRHSRLPHCRQQLCPCDYEDAKRHVTPPPKKVRDLQGLLPLPIIWGLLIFRKEFILYKNASDRLQTIAPRFQSVSRDFPFSAKSQCTVTLCHLI